MFRYAAVGLRRANQSIVPRPESNAVLGMAWNLLLCVPREIGEELSDLYSIEFSKR